MNKLEEKWLQKKQTTHHTRHLYIPWKYKILKSLVDNGVLIKLYVNFDNMNTNDQVLSKA